jgi:hypothetical protein
VQKISKNHCQSIDFGIHPLRHFVDRGPKGAVGMAMLPRQLNAQQAAMPVAGVPDGTAATAFTDAF